MTGASSEWSASRLAVGQRGVRWSVLGAALMALLGACSGGNEFPPPPDAGGDGGSHSSGTSTGSGAGTSGGACANDGETRPCHATIGQIEDKGQTLLNCYQGVQLCYHGLWSDCTAGDYSLRVIKPRAGVSEPGPLQPAEEGLALPAGGSTPVPNLLLNATEQDCVGDPCDPSCRSFTEGAFTLGSGMSGATLSWAAGTVFALSNAAASLYASGVDKKQCQVGADCQLDQFCSYPLTNAACAHDKCAPGGALDPTCDTCVASVCAANSDCCTYAGPCAHAPCFAGAALACGDSSMPPYDACVEYVCSDVNTAYCCDTAAAGAATAWDATCIAAYSACQPNPCPTSAALAWSSPATYPGPDTVACTQLVHDRCGATCPTPPVTCIHDPCITGAALASSPSSCDTGVATGCVASVCALQPSCCNQTTGAWDATCVALIPTACGVVCATPGTCTPIVQNQVDPACNGPDLTVAIPCKDTGGTVKPSCTVDTDCGPATSGLVCNTSKLCQPGCRGSGGNACPAGQSCSSGTSTIGICTGCTADSQCGGPTSGLVCNPSSTPVKQCQYGCRGSGGNACPAMQQCSSTTSAQGQCIVYKVPDPANPGQQMQMTGDYVPVCNFGTAPTPTGSKVYVNVYATGMGGIPGQPAGNNANVKATCSSTQTVFPGKCIDVPCNTTIAGWQPAEIFVNPPDPPPSVSGYTQIAECNYQNNWTVNLDKFQPPQPAGSPVTCDSPSCAVSLGKVDSHPLHLTIEAESSSFTAALQWTAIRTGIVTFLTSNAYATTWGAVGAFPDNAVTPCTCSSQCVKTTPGMVQLPVTAASALALALPATIISTAPAPYVTAFDNALTFAANDLATFVTPVPPLNEAVVLILASDPTSAASQCGGTTNANVTGALVAKAATAYSTKGIRTFVIAAPAAASTSLRNAALAIASAGGGRSYYYPNPAGSNIANALMDIQNYADNACSYALPEPTLFDPASTTVSYNTNALGLNALANVQPSPAQVATAKAAGQTYLDACLLACQSATPTDGYCYDDYLPPTGSPTRIVMCPHTCGLLGADPFTAATGPQHGFAAFNPGCPSLFVGGLGPPLSPYQGSCPGAPGNGQKPLWTFLAYSTTTPGDSSGAPSVTFKVQTADAVNGVCPNTVSSYTTAKTAAVASSYGGGTPWDTQTCPMSGGTRTKYPGTPTNNMSCPVDLAALLNGVTTSGNQPDGGTPSTGAAINGPALADCMALSVTLKTNASGTLAPQLNNLELRYSCVSAE
jgi:hypothetical protein